MCSLPLRGAEIAEKAVYHTLSMLPFPSPRSSSLPRSLTRLPAFWLSRFLLFPSVPLCLCGCFSFFSYNASSSIENQKSKILSIFSLFMVLSTPSPSSRADSVSTGLLINCMCVASAWSCPSVGSIAIHLPA